MNEETKKAAKKIAKCLALSNSENQNEAEAALRQAKALMQKYQLTERDASISAVNERCSTTSTIKTPQYIKYLAGIVAHFFGCELIIQRSHYEKAYLRFIGIGAKPELAGYTFEVLQRQLKGARRQYLMALPNIVQNRKNRTGNVFCLAWVNNIHKQVRLFANPSDKDTIDSYIEKEYGDIGISRKLSANINSKDIVAWEAGKDAASNVLLHQPVHARANLHIAGTVGSEELTASAG